MNLIRLALTAKKNNRNLGTGYSTLRLLQSSFWDSQGECEKKDSCLASYAMLSFTDWGRWRQGRLKIVHSSQLQENNWEQLVSSSQCLQSFLERLGCQHHAGRGGKPRYCVEGCLREFHGENWKKLPNGKLKPPTVCGRTAEREKSSSCGFQLRVKNWILINAYWKLQVKARIAF